MRANLSANRIVLSVIRDMRDRSNFGLSSRPHTSQASLRLTTSIGAGWPQRIAELQRSFGTLEVVG